MNFPILCLSLVMAAAPPERHAVLVACSRYDRLPGNDLPGTAKDVDLFERVLIEHYQFRPGGIVKLVADDKNRRPTRQNIRNAIKDLARKAGEGDRVVFYFGGHGSQQPSKDLPAPYLPGLGGKDQILLPVDFAPDWDFQGQTFRNAIADHELDEWLREIDARAVTWVVIDACNSGGASRDATGRPRGVELQQFIPAGLSEAAADRAARVRAERGGRGADRPALTWSAIYASERNQQTYEQLLPPRRVDPQGKYPAEVHGMLSFALCRTLWTAQEPLTYRELIRRAYAQYDTWAVAPPLPQPQLEGLTTDDFVLRSDRPVVRKRVELSQKKGQVLKLNAGRLDGLTAGTVVAIHPPVEQEKPTPENLKGYVRITPEGIGMFDSAVEPFPYDNHPAPVADALPDSGFCEVVLIDYGTGKLPVNVSSVGAAAEESAQDVKAEAARVREIVESIAAEPTAAIQYVADPGAAQVAVRVGPTGRFLVPAALPVTPREPTPSRYSIAVPGGAATRIWLLDRLDRIARARNLGAIAEELQTGSLADSKGTAGPDRKKPVNLAVELLRHQDANDWTGTPEVWTSNMVKHGGDRFSVRVHNTGSQPIYFHVLFEDSGYGIQVLFPHRTFGDNRLEPDEQRGIPRQRLRADTTGQERLIIIAEAAESLAEDFTPLEQPPISEEPAGRRGPGRLRSPLARLLDDARARQGRTRSFPESDLRRVAVRIIAWDTEK